MAFLGSVPQLDAQAGRLVRPKNYRTAENVKQESPVKPTQKTEAITERERIKAEKRRRAELQRIVEKNQRTVARRQRTIQRNFARMQRAQRRQLSRQARPYRSPGLFSWLGLRRSGPSEGFYLPKQ